MQSLVNSPLDNARSPGEVLRAAREQLGFSQQEVAAKLRLSVQCVADLEQDDYQNMVAAVYLRGYLRAYAQLLQVSEVSILSLYDAQDHALSQTEQVSSKEALPVYRQTGGHRQHKMARWVSLVAAFILVALVVIWWQDQNTPVPLVKPTKSVLNLPATPKVTVPTAAPVSTPVLVSPVIPTPVSSHPLVNPSKAKAKPVKKIVIDSPTLKPTYHIEPAHE